MAVPPPPTTKPGLRSALRRMRREHVDRLRATARLDGAADQAARLLLSGMADWRAADDGSPGRAGSADPVTLPVMLGGKEARTIALYVAVGPELDTGPLGAMLEKAGHHLALPQMTSGSPVIQFASWACGQCLVPGPLGIPQPTDDVTVIEPDVIVAPLVGFDRSGRRLGQGLGCYDRAFSTWPSAWRIGYAWSVQQVDTLPVDAWDLPLHAVVTEREWIACGNRP